MLECNPPRKGPDELMTCSTVDTVDTDGTSVGPAQACVGLSVPTDFYIDTVLSLQALFAAGKSCYNTCYSNSHTAYQ